MRDSTARAVAAGPVPRTDLTTPTNITHGIMPPLDHPPRDKMKKKMLIAERALADLDSWRGAVVAAGLSTFAQGASADK